MDWKLLKLTGIMTDRSYDHGVSEGHCFVLPSDLRTFLSVGRYGSFAVAGLFGELFIIWNHIVEFSIHDAEDNNHNAEEKNHHPKGDRNPLSVCIRLIPVQTECKNK